MSNIHHKTKWKTIELLAERQWCVDDDDDEGNDDSVRFLHASNLENCLTDFASWSFLSSNYFFFAHMCENWTIIFVSFHL